MPSACWEDNTKFYLKTLNEIMCAGFVWQYKRVKLQPVVKTVIHLGVTKKMGGGG
jgi:type IV secretory pathway TrbF-like protein